MASETVKSSVVRKINCAKVPLYLTYTILFSKQESSLERMEKSCEVMARPILSEVRFRSAKLSLPTLNDNSETIFFRGCLPIRAWMIGCPLYFLLNNHSVNLRFLRGFAENSSCSGDRMQVDRPVLRANTSFFSLTGGETRGARSCERRKATAIATGTGRGIRARETS